MLAGRRVDLADRDARTHGLARQPLRLLQDLVVLGDLGGGRHKFCGTITVDRSGPFGYTVRLLPAHPELADKAELGLVTNA